MNNIHEKDWAEDSWGGGYSGMDSHSDWCTVDKAINEKPAEISTEKDNVKSSIIAEALPLGTVLL